MTCTRMVPWIHTVREFRLMNVALLIILLACSSVVHATDTLPDRTGEIDDQSRPDGMSPDAPQETLELVFMLGTWQVDASWPLGGGIRAEGSGSVTCAFDSDGQTLRREWDIQMNEGTHLLGHDTHRFDVEKQTWLAEWVPRNSNTAPVLGIVGVFEEGELHELHEGVNGGGQAYSARTRFFDIDDSGGELSFVGVPPAPINTLKRESNRHPGRMVGKV